MSVGPCKHYKSIAAYDFMRIQNKNKLQEMSLLSSELVKAVLKKWELYTMNGGQDRDGICSNQFLFSSCTNNIFNTHEIPLPVHMFMMSVL